MKPSTNQWLKAASDDLKTIDALANLHELTNIAAFHAQQAIEKSLKAAIEEFERGFVKTHNLQTLISIADVALDYNELIIEELDQLYIDARYPGDLGLLPQGKPTIPDAQEYLAQAKTIFNQIHSIIK